MSSLVALFARLAVIYGLCRTEGAKKFLCDTPSENKRVSYCKGVCCWKEQRLAVTRIH